MTTPADPRPPVGGAFPLDWNEDLALQAIERGHTPSGADLHLIATAMRRMERALREVALRAAPAGEAVRFRIVGTAHDHDAVYVEERSHRDGTQLWAVKRGSGVLAKDGEWEWEPQPSSRDDDFVTRTRYASVAEAVAAYESQADRARAASGEVGHGK